jgi:hypothetical protein
VEEVGALEALEVGDNDLSDEVPLIAAESAALGQAAAVDVEGRGEEAIHPDLGPRTREQEAVPMDDPRVFKAQTLHGGDEEPTVSRVIGLGEVRVQQPSRQAKLLEPGAETKVVADIVRDVAATEEG